MATVWGSSVRRKWIFSGLLIVLGVLAAFSIFDALLNAPGFRKLDEKGDAYYAETLSRSVYTYGVVRGINGLISVIQGTDVAFSPAGVGVSLALGEVLDPVNDLVERFSWVMLVSTTALGIQTFLMELGAWIGLRFLLPPAMLLLLIGIWRRRWGRFDFRTAGTRLVVVALLIRFCLPAVALVSDGIYHHFLKEKYEESLRSLEAVNREISEADLVRKEADRSYLGRIIDSVQIRETVATLKEKLSDYGTFMVTLITIFIIQTVILPVLFLWLFLRLIGRLYGRRVPLLPRSL